MKLEWRKCPCGSPACKRQYPANLGTFYAGSGFDPEEVALLDSVFYKAERTEKAEDTASRLRWPDTTGK